MPHKSPMSTDQRIQPLTDPKDVSQAAALMVCSEPWITLKLSTEIAVSLLTDPTKEVHATRDAQGVTGFIVGDMDQAVDAALAVLRLDRHAVRCRFEQRFTVERMARDYVDVYWRLLRDERARERALTSRVA